MSNKLIRDIADIKFVESTPIYRLNLPCSNYELIAESASTYGNKSAIHYLEFAKGWDSEKGDSQKAQVIGITYRELLENITRVANVLPNLPETHYALLGSEAAGLAVFACGGTVLLAGINGCRSTGVLKNLYALIDEFQVTGFSAVPAILATLLTMEKGDVDLGSVRFALCGAALGRYSFSYDIRLGQASPNNV